MPSWVASNASMAGLRPPKTVTQWPVNTSGKSPLAPGGDAAAASATSGKIVSGPAREKFEAGKARLAADDVEGAIADFGEAARLDPKFDDAFVQRGQAYFKMGNVERAVADFSQALRIDPRNALAYKARGMALLYKNDTDGAIIDLTKAIQYAEIDPGSISTLEVFYARRSRSALYDHKQLYDRELIDLSAMIDGFWKNPELAATLKGTYGEAGASALVASIYRLRSLVHLKRKSVDSAVGDLSFALQLDPAHALQFLVERARIQEKAGRNEQAAADYKQALDLNPKSEDLKAALARVKKHS
jgi:tetratricopeptide (TPR) repeat protein